MWNSDDKNIAQGRVELVVGRRTKGEISWENRKRDQLRFLSSSGIGVRRFLQRKRGLSELKRVWARKNWKL